MRHNVHRIVVLTTCITFSIFISPSIFAQGYVQVGSGASTSSVDLTMENPNETLTFGGASGVGDAATAYCYTYNDMLDMPEDYDWYGDINMNSSGIFNVTGAGTLHLFGNTITGGTGVEFVKDGGARIDASTSNSNFTGSLTIREGSFAASSNFGSKVLTMGNNAIFEIWNMSESYEQIQGGGRILTSSGGSLTIGSNTQSSSYSGIIEGGGSFTKIGSEDLGLGGLNQNFTGSISVQGGELEVLGHNFGNSLLDISSGATFSMHDTTQSYEQIQGAGTILIGSASRYDWNWSEEHPNSGNGNASLTVGSNTLSSTFSGRIEGDGTFTKTGSEDLDLTGTASHNFTGTVNVNDGILSVSGNNFGNKLLNVGSGAMFDMYDTTQTFQQIQGDGTVAMGDASLTIGSNTIASNFDGVFSGGTLTKTGTASFTLGDGGSIFVEQFNVNQGEFVMQGNTSLSAWDGVSAYVPGMTVASGASMRLSPTVSGSPYITDTLIDVQGKLILEMQDYPTDRKSVV